MLGSVLKTRLKKEGSQLTTHCSQLKMQAADGNYYRTDVADTEQLLRLTSLPLTLTPAGKGCIEIA